MLGEDQKSSHVLSNFQEMTQVHSHFCQVKVWSTKVHKDGATFYVRIRVDKVTILPSAIVKGVDGVHRLSYPLFVEEGTGHIEEYHEEEE